MAECPCMNKEKFPNYRELCPEARRPQVTTPPKPKVHMLMGNLTIDVTNIPHDKVEELVTKECNNLKDFIMAKYRAKHGEGV